MIGSYFGKPIRNWFLADSQLRCSDLGEPRWTASNNLEKYRANKKRRSRKDLTAEYAGNSERTQRKERNRQLKRNARTKLKLKIKINAVRASHPDRILPRKFHVDPLTPQRAAHSVLCASFVQPAA
jgi:hypothetical protein